MSTITSCVQTFKKLWDEKYGFRKKQLEVMESFQMQNTNYLDNKFDLFSLFAPLRAIALASGQSAWFFSIAEGNKFNNDL